MLRAAQAQDAESASALPPRSGQAYRPTVATRFFDGVRYLAGKLHADVIGLANVPRSGPAILVANHTFGWDVAFPLAALQQRLGRPAFVLGEHLWWKIPLINRLAAAVGVVEGTPEVAARLLHDGELLLVLPGGLREAVKPRELRYQLLWGERYGFVKLAVRHQVPLIPLACVGADDLFDFVGNAYARGRRWFGSKQLPVPLPARVLPIPHLTSLRFIVGEPIEPRVPAERAEDLDALRPLRREVAGALHELIENELARRAGIEL
ncbi:MAG TPA: lysophospholipid acyltransferase family protein [Polyangiales bacterium]